jgi:phage tail-like protein
MARDGDPYAGFNFRVEVDGVSVAAFSECSGLTGENDVIEYRDGTEENRVRKLPGLKKVSEITLQRGFTDNKELWDWRKTVMDGKTERKSVTIVLQNEAREDALSWNLFEVWCSKWEGPAFNSKNSEVTIEKLTLVYETLEWA